MKREEKIKRLEQTIKENSANGTHPNFEKWLDAHKTLEAIDPQNKLLEIGYYGKPFSGGLVDR